MKIRLWWIPLLLALAPLAGRAPLARDIPGFFLPIRTHTAHRLLEGQPPWLNAANGCTEAWFANPETGVLYPPAWFHLVLPPAAGISLEVGFHLALLALGVGILSRKLGAGTAGVAVAEAASWSSGAVLAVVGMLNNLEAMAWVPWMILAARSRRRWTVPATAAACTLGWLAGAPVVWAIGAALAVVFAGSETKRVLAGLGLSLLLVAVQLVPFVSWVLEGDRGGGAAIRYLSGAVAPAGWIRLLVPGPPATAAGTPWAASLFLGAPLLLLAWLGLRSAPWAAVPVAALGALATLPTLDDGRLYLVLTHSLVRYPSRFAVLALALLLPFIGTGLGRWLDGTGRLPALLLALATLAALPLATDIPGLLEAAVPAALLLTAVLLPRHRALRVAAVVAGLAATLAAGWPLLGLGATARSAWPWQETAGNGRLYTPPPSASARAWLARSEHRYSLWPLGYFNLEAHTELVRSNAPLIHRRLAAHLAHADRGPVGRWWLDTLAAPWMILANPPPPGQDLERIRTLGGMWLVNNLRARPLVTAWSEPPSGGATMAPALLAVVRSRPERIVASILTARAVWVSLAIPPVRGWRFTLDGRSLRPVQGPGILQVFPVGPGRHVLRGAYRPPGFPVTACCSGAALLTLLLLALARILHEGSSRAARGAVPGGVLAR